MIIALFPTPTSSLTNLPLRGIAVPAAPEAIFVVIACPVHLDATGAGGASRAENGRQEPASAPGRSRKAAVDQALTFCTAAWT